MHRKRDSHGVIIAGRVLLALAGAGALSAELAWVSSGFHSLQDWPSDLGCLAIGGGLMAAIWRALRCEAPPGWLGKLLLIAAALRLALSVAWFTALPVFGHGSPAETAGYVMADAHDRDQAAWKLAKSDRPLLSAFQGYKRVDQYGGMLFLSALAYRLLNPAKHQPLIIAALASMVSAITVLISWAMARRAWGLIPAAIAALGTAFYPEAVLLGSSQMREAFLMPLAAGAFYGLLVYAQERKAQGLVWGGAAVTLSVPFSPPTAGLMLGCLGLTALAFPGLYAQHRQQPKSRSLSPWLIAAGLTILVLIGVWLTLRQYAPAKITNPIALLGWWLEKSADWQTFLSRQASGWMQKIFNNTPQWMHIPLLLLYGSAQPFLPAALVAYSDAPIWSWIVIWRAAGWTLLLPLLIYAPLQAFRKGSDWFARGLILPIWVSILVSAFRGGSDLWDNPRYRLVFISIQLALAAWSWVEQRRSQDRWLGRLGVGIGVMLAWFLPWYLRRYTAFTWPVVDLFKTLGLGIATAFLYAIWDWARTAPTLNANDRGKNQTSS